MSRRVQTADDLGGFQSWWSSLPFLTRSLGLTWGITALLLQLDLFPITLFTLDFQLILREFQIWRLVTSASILGYFSSRFAMRMIWLFVYSSVLERSMTEYSPGDYAFLILFSLCLLNLLALIHPLVTMKLISSPLVFVIMYIWSREHVSQTISIFGLVQIKGFYLPWAMLAVDMAFGAPTSLLFSDLTGVLVGHIYYFLTTLLPRRTGKHYLKCPLWLTRFMAPYYKTSQYSAPPDRGNREGAQTSGFQAFRGRGHRLQD